MAEHDEPFRSDFRDHYKGGVLAEALALTRAWDEFDAIIAGDLAVRGSVLAWVYPPDDPDVAAYTEAQRRAAVGTREVETVVVAVIPEFHQVQVKDLLGNLYAINRKTQGIDMSTLREGQRVDCTVTVHLPRVLRAMALPTSSTRAYK